MQENYLAKWLNNELTDQELETFKESDEYASYQKIIKATQDLKSPVFDVNKALASSKLKRTSKNVKVIKLNPVKKYIRIAAVFALLLTSSYFYFNSLDETISTDLAQNKTLNLPDTSEVILNAETKITYNKKNWEKERLLTLKGEAFFKVAKGKKFTVETSSGLVTVLGTEFNVKNRENFFEVTCFEGLVSVTLDQKITKLPAGSTFLMIHNEVLSVSASKDIAPSWLHHESSFKSIPLAFVLKEFERQFNVKIEAKNIDVKKLFTGSFNHKNIDLALESICNPNQIKFNLEGNKVLLYAENAP